METILALPHRHPWSPYLCDKAYEFLDKLLCEHQPVVCQNCSYVIQLPKLQFILEYFRYCLQKNEPNLWLSEFSANPFKLWSTQKFQVSTDILSEFIWWCKHEVLMNKMSLQEKQRILWHIVPRRRMYSHEQDLFHDSDSDSFFSTNL